MMWFETLTGLLKVPAGSQEYHAGRAALVSRQRQSAGAYGQLETPTLAELRERVHHGGSSTIRISVREVVANVQHLHTDVSNAGALFGQPEFDYQDGVTERHT